MSDIAIRAHGLGKQFTIGAPQERYKTLRDTLADMAMAPLRGVRRALRGEARLRPHTETFWALRDVSFEVRHGEVMGIIGRNGAGKSTLLKVLSRITEPTEGFAELRGRVGTLLEVGTGFHPELTGRENIYLNGTILGMKRAEIERQFDEIVAFAEVERFIDTPVKHYSSGMYLRLAFAVAAHLDPEILIVDEVLAVGDAQFQKKCLGKMEDVASQGRTVLFVSHNMSAVRTLCSQTILLKSGQVAAAGPTDAILAQYLASSAADLVATLALPRSGPGAPGQATSLQFASSAGTPQAEFRLGEPWRIALEFELSRPLDQVTAAVGLVTLDSFPVITYWSQPKDLPAGRYRVEFVCDLPLGPCELQCAVGLSTYGRPFYYVPGLGHVSVSEIAEGEQPAHTARGGLLLNVRKYEIEPAG
ncbi:MAG: polysaccharide ABC transporter ATP-binding protein [Kouleothrix sp.]